MIVPVPEPERTARAIAVELRVEPDPGPDALAPVRRLSWVIKHDDPPPPSMPLVPASQVKIAYGPTSTAMISLDRPSRVEFPVLYYPRLLRVTDHGKPIAYGN